MAENSKIEWCNHTLNPWVGCTKISPACDNCYAEGWAKRSGMVKWGQGQERRRTSESNWKQPIKWNKQSKIAFDAWDVFKKTNPGLTDYQLIQQGFIEPKKPRVFCASLADVFDNEVPNEWRSDLWALIKATPYLDWLIVTKRIGNALTMLPCDFNPENYPNVWIGATVCDQEEADRDIPKLLAINAAIRFLSIEPMLGKIDLRNGFCAGCNEDEMDGTCDCDGHIYGIDWVIVGGESGTNARPMFEDWVISIRDQCQSSGARFFFKQWGEWCPENQGDFTGRFCGKIGGPTMYRVGKKTAGRMLDGITWDQYPTQSKF